MNIYSLFRATEYRQIIKCLWLIGSSNWRGLECSRLKVYWQFDKGYTEKGKGTSIG
jgi:hypothetical protein